MSQLPAPQVLLALELAGAPHPQEAVFTQPVLVRAVQVVPAGMVAHPGLLPQFIGQTQPAPFQLEVGAED
jgi:hypothetical protein